MCLPEFFQCNKPSGQCPGRPHLPLTLPLAPAPLSTPLHTREIQANASIFRPANLPQRAERERGREKEESCALSTFNCNISEAFAVCVSLCMSVCECVCALNQYSITSSRCSTHSHSHAPTHTHTHSFYSCKHTDWQLNHVWLHDSNSLPLPLSLSLFMRLLCALTNALFAPAVSNLSPLTAPPPLSSFVIPLGLWCGLCLICIGCQLQFWSWPKVKCQADHYDRGRGYRCRVEGGGVVRVC